jgi:hypothetical protein
MKAPASALAAFLVFAAWASADPAWADSTEAGSRVMVAFEAAGLADRDALRDSLESAIAASPRAIAVLRYEPGEEELALAAAKAGCPVAIDVRAAVSSPGIKVEWRYLPSGAGGVELGAGSFEKPQPSPGDLVSSFWIELAQDLGPAIDALPEDSVIVKAPAGTRVEGLGEAFVVPEAGEIERPIYLPSFVRWKASSKSYMDAEGALVLEAPAQRLEIAMRKIPAWTAEASLYGFSFPELRASILLGKRLFARATVTDFFTGLSLQDYDGPPPMPSLFSSYSLLQAGFGIGLFFEDPDRKFRAYSALDAFLRFAAPPHQPIFIDPVAPLGLSPLFGAEWGLDARIKLCVELGGIFYPYALVDRMLASMGKDKGKLVAYGPGMFTDQSGWFLEFPLPRLGLRIYF